MQIVLLVAGGLFGLAAVAALYRIIRGPSAIDRIAAADVLNASILCLLGVEMAVNQHTNTLPVLLVLALFAIVGSISAARFLAWKEEG
jgi:multicomponent Na+:H+ antiporter subunit F